MEHFSRKGITAVRDHLTIQQIILAVLVYIVFWNDLASSWTVNRSHGLLFLYTKEVVHGRPDDNKAFEMWTNVVYF